MRRVFDSRLSAVLVMLALGVGTAPWIAYAAGSVTNCSSYGSNGTPGDLAWALQGGGTVSFACSGTIIVPEILVTISTTIDATGQTVALSGNNANRVFSVSRRAHLHLVRLTVRDGNGTPTGGGILSTGGRVTLTESTLTRNFHCSCGIGGGGLHADGGVVTLTNSTLTENAGNYGGGLAASSDAAVTLTNSTVSANLANYGGGLAALGYTAITLTNSTVSGNSAVGGGGLYAFYPTRLQVDHSTVSGNAANNGGGLIIYGSVVSLSNSTVSGNTANGDGGGVFAWGSYVGLTNSTISANAAGSDGGGFFIDHEFGALSYLPLASSIVAGNSASGIGPECANGVLASQGYNLVGDVSGCTFTPRTGDLVNVDPILGPLQDNGGPTLTHALLPGSPAIDTGNPRCPPPRTDQRGIRRPQGAACDIGSYEFVP